MAIAAPFRPTSFFSDRVEGFSPIDWGDEDEVVARLSMLDALSFIEFTDRPKAVPDDSELIRGFSDGDEKVLVLSMNFDELLPNFLSRFGYLVRLQFYDFSLYFQSNFTYYSFQPPAFSVFQYDHLGFLGWGEITRNSDFYRRHAGGVEFHIDEDGQQSQDALFSDVELVEERIKWMNSMEFFRVTYLFNAARETRPTSVRVLELDNSMFNSAGGKFSLRFEADRRGDIPVTTFLVATISLSWSIAIFAVLRAILGAKTNPESRTAVLLSKFPLTVFSILLVFLFVIARVVEAWR